MVTYSTLLHPTRKGLYCPPGDFYIDPLVPVDRAVITHGHADHARAGHQNVIATPETLDIMAIRYGENFTQNQQPLNYNQPLCIKDVQLTFASAGHILGSAQAVIEWQNMRIVAAGDFKRRKDLTCAPFEVVPCDVFISEATFALPVFKHPDDHMEISRLCSSVEQFPDRPHLVGAYALGKAQRVIALLRDAGYDAPIYLHGAMKKLCDLYSQYGIDLGTLMPATIHHNGRAQGFAGSIIIAPPSALSDKWSRRFKDAVTVFCSGWMQVRARAKQRGIELPLILSDHADWNELTATIKDIQPKELWITHGREDALLRWAELEGIPARPLRLVGYEDEDE